MNITRWNEVIDLSKNPNFLRIDLKLKRRLTQLKLNVQKKNLTPKDRGDYRHDCYRLLINVLNDDDTYQRLNSGDKQKSIKNFIASNKLFPGRLEWIDSIYNAIENEKYFNVSDEFWMIPYHYFQIWYERIIHFDLPYHESFVLLSIIAIKNKYNPAQFEDTLSRPYIKLGSALTGFSGTTVSKKIKSLEFMNIIETKRHGRYKELQIKIKNWQEFVKRSTNKNPLNLISPMWKEPLLGLDNYDELQWLPYVYCLPFSKYNPFISFVHPNIIVHRSMFNPHVLLFSLFSEQQIQDLHRVWVKTHYTRSITDKYERAKEYLVKQLAQTTIPRLTPHYEQIRRCWPILHFIARRERLVDRKILLDNIYLQGALQWYTKTQLKTLLVDQQIDRRYFWYCLRRDKFKEEWEKKYSIEELDPFYPVYEKIPAMIRNNLRTGIAQMYHDPIRRYQRARRRYQELINIWEFLEDNNLESLMSNFRCLDIKTHRITFRAFPLQRIRKDNRLIIRASHGKLFLLMDISSAELTILKWFIIKQQVVKKEMLQELTFMNIADRLNLTREEIKSIAYPYLYGASIKTIAEETDQPESVVKQFRKVVQKFPGVKEFRQKATTYAKNNGLSLPTSLRHQFPIFGDPHTQGLSLLIQGTGAELLREWVLEVKKIGKAPEISVIIHDELIMEVDEKDVIKRIPQVEECLKRAQEKILPGIEVKSKCIISSSWAKSQGVSFSDGVLGYLP